jgi:hypothetical protein
MGEYVTDKTEIAKIKAAAVTYARLFLAKKYYEEYQELYRAYCINRGVQMKPVGRPTKASDVDERAILAAKESQDNVA